MQLNNWKIFDKSGSQLNWYTDSYINLDISSPTGINATGYIIVDGSALASNIEITNSGYKYGDADTSIAYSYAFDPSAQTVILNPTNDISIGFVDVSIFYPDASVTRGIESITLLTNDLSANTFTYPSVVYSAAIFLDPVSQGLVETEHLYIFQQLDSSYIRPYDTSAYLLKVQMYGEEDQIKLFSVNDNEQTIEWTDTLYYDINTYAENTPISINIGFKAEDEGIYERKLRFYNTINGVDYLMAEILVNAEAIGEDERHRSLLTNFGLPDPKEFPKLFKETDINEDLPDYEVINPKSKQMILEHGEIIPYIGTYKALINAIKWLGYDDIYIREWFKNVEENKKISLIVPFNATDYIDPSTGKKVDGRTLTLLKFSADKRKSIKKLNQLSLNYCITRETGETDAWGTPETENCYTYNLEEVFIKLLSLKKWLEKNIIGVNARIIDITGEGIYYERYINLIYSTQNHGFDYYDSQTITPYSTEGDSELLQGDASISLTLLEFSRTTIEDLPYKFSDFIDYAWNPSDPSITMSITDASYIIDASSYLEVGPPLAYPFPSVRDIQYKAYIFTDSGVIPETHVSKPLWIYNNQVKFYNIFDEDRPADPSSNSGAIFHDSSVYTRIKLEKAYIKDVSNANWQDSSMYSIYPSHLINLNTDASVYLLADASYAVISGSGSIVDASMTYAFNIGLDPSYFFVDGSIFVIADTSTVIQSELITEWIMESSMGNKWHFDDYIYLNMTDGGKLRYANTNTWPGYQSTTVTTPVNNYNQILLSFENFNTRDASGNIVSFVSNKSYFLEIIDGRIILDTSISSDTVSGLDSSTFITYYIDYKYGKEQYINLNMEYTTKRMPLYVVDPSIYYWADPSGLSGTTSALVQDNSIYTMVVHNVGNYLLDAYAWDGYNNLFANQAKKDHQTWIKYPTIYSLIDSSDNLNVLNCASTFMTETDVDSLILKNSYPIFDRLPAYTNLKLKYDGNNNPYIQVPDMTFFQNVADASNFNRFFNLTERAASASGTTLVINSIDVSFYAGDNLKLVLLDKGSYIAIDEASTHISSITPTAGVPGISVTTDATIPSSMVIDTSHDVYVLNETYRFTANPSNLHDTSTFMIDISGNFSVNQLVNIISFDACTGKEYGASYRVLAKDGSTHTFNWLFPQFIIDNSLRYTNYAKHAFSAPVDYVLEANSVQGEDTSINIYFSEHHQYFLDNTFKIMYLPFDHQRVIDGWYAISDDLVNSTFYYYDKSVSVDISTLVILKAEYDVSNYMLNQKNIWTATDNITKEIVFKVHNESVPFIFGVADNYDITVSSYDLYGNITTTK